MEGDEQRRSLLQKLVRKVGTVAGAAAALLASNAGTVDANQPHSSPAQPRAVTLSNLHDGTGRRRDLPPPLVLKSSMANAKAMFAAGHRSHSSHSSHSSHRSHVSGASHSSHFSSSIAPSTPSADSTAPAPSARTRSRSLTRTPKATPSLPQAEDATPVTDSKVPPTTPGLPNAPRTSVKPAPKLPNFSAGATANGEESVDPSTRYRIITMQADKGFPVVFIKDLLTNESKQIRVGETIGDATLMSISLPTRTIRLKPKGGEEFALRQQ